MLDDISMVFNGVLDMRSKQEMQEYTAVLDKVLTIRDIVMKVNATYIKSITYYIKKGNDINSFSLKKKKASI